MMQFVVFVAVPAIPSWRPAAQPVMDPRPFLPLPRMSPVQTQTMDLLSSRAGALSEAATPALLARLDSPAMRAHLRACCSSSGVGAWPAEALRRVLLANVRSAELVHNFDLSFVHDVTLEIMDLPNASAYFPQLWALGFLGFFGPMEPAWGHPQSPEDAGEEVRAGCK